MRRNFKVKNRYLANQFFEQGRSPFTNTFICNLRQSPTRNSHPPMRSLDFTHRDLRNCSFRKHILNGADFTGADLRGCDFSGAQLIGTCFEQVRTGQTNRQRIVWLSTIILTFLGMGHAVSNLVFGSLGQTPADKAWNYVIALLISLGICGALSGLQFLLKPMFLQKVAIVLSGVTSGAVAGFFYGGVATGKNPQWAIVGAVAGGLLLGSLAIRETATSKMVLHTAGGISAYGFAFFTGTIGLSLGHLALLKREFLIPGILSVGLCLLYLWFTFNALITVAKTIQRASGTLFRRANLTNAQFDNASLAHTDFFNATGWITKKPPIP